MRFPGAETGHASKQQFKEAALNRRDFIESSAVAGLSVGIPGILSGKR